MGVVANVLVCFEFGWNCVICLLTVIMHFDELPDDADSWKTQEFREIVAVKM